MENGKWKIKRSRRKTNQAVIRLLLFFVDTPAAIRTRDLQLRRLTLYPAELRVHAKFKIQQTRTRVNKEFRLELTAVYSRSDDRVREGRWRRRST